MYREPDVSFGKDWLIILTIPELSYIDTVACYKLFEGNLNLTLS